MDGPSRGRLGQACQRILVVDDDPNIVALLRRILESAGYEVFTAASGEEALESFSRWGIPHLAVIDIMMPCMDGLALCAAISEFADLPVIMLSAVSDEATIVESIQKYAEDYVTKPFKAAELLARVERVLRRFKDYSYALEPVTKIDSRLAIDFPHRLALLDDREVPLTRTETRLLYILVGHAGQPVPADYLLRRIWPHEEVFEDALRVHIHRLRGKIEREPNRPAYITTERNVGYCLWMGN